MIYVINSARYTLSRHILRDINMGYAVLLIADECHHYASAENRKIFEFLPYLPEQEKTSFPWAFLPPRAQTAMNST